jgi:hypothetical protein
VTVEPIYTRHRRVDHESDCHMQVERSKHDASNVTVDVQPWKFRGIRADFAFDTIFQHMVTECAPRQFSELSG